jgi:hypothetical protein
MPPNSLRHSQAEQAITAHGRECFFRETGGSVVLCGMFVGYQRRSLCHRHDPCLSIGVGVSGTGQGGGIREQA